jgi:hypothetical protein
LKKALPSLCDQLGLEVVKEAMVAKPEAHPQHLTLPQGIHHSHHRRYFLIPLVLLHASVQHSLQWTTLPVLALVLLRAVSSNSQHQDDLLGTLLKEQEPVVVP